MDVKQVWQPNCRELPDTVVNEEEPFLIIFPIMGWPEIRACAEKKLNLCRFLIALFDA